MGSRSDVTSLLLLLLLLVLYLAEETKAGCSCDSPDAEGNIDSQEGEDHSKERKRKPIVVNVTYDIPNWKHMQNARLFKLVDKSTSTLCHYEVRMVPQDDEDEYPREIPMAVCKEQDCECEQIGKRGTYSCKQLLTNIPVFNMRTKEADIIKNVPYGCICAHKPPHHKRKNNDDEGEEL